MTNSISTAATTPATGAAAHDQPTDSSQTTAGKPLSPFLALLAMLGNDVQPDTTAPGSPSSDVAPSATDGDSSPPTKVMPPGARAADPLHPAKHNSSSTDKNAHAPSGIVQGTPLLPMPIMLGTVPPAATTVGEKGSAPDPATGGVSAHPILGTTLADVTTNAANLADFADATSNPLTDAAQATGGVRQVATATKLEDAPTTDDAPDSATSGTSSPSAPHTLADLVKSALTPQSAQKQQSAPAVSSTPMPQPTTANASFSSPNSASEAPAGLPSALVSAMSGAASESKASGTATNITPALQQATSAVTAPTTSKAHEDAAPDFASVAAETLPVTPQATSSTSPLPTTGPTHPAVANAAHQIVSQAQLLQNGQTAEMRLRLRPPDLGEVNVTVRRDATGGLTVHLVPATREASSALTANMHFLRNTLDAHSQGRGAEVTLGQHDTSGSSQQQGREQATTGHNDDGTMANGSTSPVSKIASTQPRASTSKVDYDA